MPFLKPKAGASGEFGPAVSCQNCGQPAYRDATCPKCGRDPMSGGGRAAGAPPPGAPAPPSGPAAPFAVEFVSHAPAPRPRGPPAGTALPTGPTTPAPRPGPGQTFQAPVVPVASPAPKAAPERGPAPGYVAAPPWTGASEALVGVVEQLQNGITDYDLVFTSHRILVVKRGSSGFGGGVTGSIIATAMRAGQKSTVERYSGMSFDQVLASHAKNFQIPYAAVEKARLVGGISAVTTPRVQFWIGGKKVGFEFMGSLWIKNKGELKNAAALLQGAFGPRVDIKGV
jgi:hypothetical protein